MWDRKEQEYLPLGTAPKFHDYILKRVSVKQNSSQLYQLAMSRQRVNIIKNITIVPPCYVWRTFTPVVKPALQSDAAIQIFPCLYTVETITPKEIINDSDLKFA